ncbi:MAG: hypothetical protein GY941_22215 [Planctomycetes bacterium]|nr:hypothetical protein [Planctomycetota bacterium]
MNKEPEFMVDATWWSNGRINPEWIEWVNKEAKQMFEEHEAEWFEKECPLTKALCRKTCIHFEEGRAASEEWMRWAGQPKIVENKCKLWGRTK